MRRFVYTFALLLTAASIMLPVAAVRAQSSNAAAIEACMKEIRSALKAGQKLTEQQRMVAEEQCRARVEATAPRK